MLKCFYALGGINYKNGVISVCPRQSDQLVYAHETIKPSELFNHKNFKLIRKMLYHDKWPSGCDTCEDMERDNLNSMRKDYHLVLQILDWSLGFLLAFLHQQLLMHVVIFLLFYY